MVLLLFTNLLLSCKYYCYYSYLYVIIMCKNLCVRINSVSNTYSVNNRETRI